MPGSLPGGRHPARTTLRIASVTRPVNFAPMRWRWIPLLLVPLLLAACGSEAAKKKAVSAEPNPFGPTGIPAGMRRNLEGGTPISPGGNSASSVLDRHVDEEHIVWTDPDDPDAEIPDLNGLLEDS